MFKFLVIFAGFILLSTAAYAHPPSKITLSFKESSQDFTVTVNHRISEKGHFINQIKVFLNGEEIESKKFTFQNNKQIVSLLFPKPAHKQNAIITVEATCNRTNPVSSDFAIEKIISEKPDK